MRIRNTGPKIGTAYRKTGAVAAIVAAALASFSVKDAFAFKLFGMTIFGKEEPTEEVIDPVNYTVDFQTGNADKELREALETSSLLVGDKGKPVSGDLGVVIKARDDRERLIATLYEHARYGGVVNITINGVNLDNLPPNPTFNHSKPVPVVVRINPGPTFTLGTVRLQGAAAGKNAKSYGLVPGGNAGSLTILKASAKIVEDLKSEGRPLAKLENREVVANHATNRIDVTLTAEGGPVAPIGNVGIAGQRSVDPDFIRRYSRLNDGRPYSPEALKKASDRLRQLGVFSSVTIREASELAPNGTIPMTIEVSEGKQRYFGFGAQYSTIDGLGLSGFWGHRNLFGQAESLRIEGGIARIGEESDIGRFDYSAGILFSKPGAFFPSATFNASIVAKTEHPDPYNASTVTGATGLVYELTDQDLISGGGEVSWEDSEDAFGDHHYLTFSLPFEYIRDTRNDKLNPTDGYRFTASTKPSYEAYMGTVFSSFETSVSGYQAINADDTIVLAAKVAGGVLVGGNDLADIPTTRRFYAGGGGSVRGYGYQEISPYDAAGEATGGRSYVTGSFEARIGITETIGIVPFIDVGSVTDTTFPDFSDVRPGAGIGIRYATPFGPLRLDFAVPLNRFEDGTEYGIYAGIGQSF
ncbi:autotransporter assembly complex family protein [Rhizobium sp. BK251]|uniref:autotransporter assembly complex protein TamA n=1 Tax=Rhizobium sp. BK251 TaxID=2512125 RepID=UPI00104EA8FA|nr:autotransporter assembly complex family protein [Rhizobium sp. BK251]TCL72713.1 autotransporter secretion outer membrane protein TamA [Rhizobium sp. BK251]